MQVIKKRQKNRYSFFMGWGEFFEITNKIKNETNNSKIIGYLN
jgi:hypothetical protein